MAGCLQHLHDAAAATATLGTETFSDSNKPALSAAVSALRLAASQSSNSVEAGAHMTQSCVVMACVVEGCRVLFPSEPAQVSPSALGYLAGVAEVLSECLQLWEARGHNVFGCAFLPSTMMWARAMLHLFQWRLCQEGTDQYMKGKPADVHLPDGLPGRPTAPLAGIGQVISGLMLAQRTGAARGELLPGCLPATVALARLLMAGADQCEPLLEAKLKATRAVVAVAPPEVSPLYDASKAAVAVRHLQFGSLEANQVAEAHLAAVLERVTIEGKPLRPADVSYRADAADSQSLWEAVKLWRHADGRVRAGNLNKRSQWM